MKKAAISLLLLLYAFISVGCIVKTYDKPVEAETFITEFDLKYIPEYSGKPYYELNNGVPFFKADELTTAPYEYYSPLDELGRCGECIACIGKEMMPTEKREGIGMIKPSGWQLVRYDGIVSGNYLFNRCHLIGYQLTGENANECNLITGTRYLNEEGMLPFENKTASYIRKTNNHVMYRATPIFKGDDLLAYGVLIEAESVEDNGTGLRLNVFCYNVQPHINIDYSSGKSYLMDSDGLTTKICITTALETTVTSQKSAKSEKCDFILNTNSKKFHLPDCKSVTDIKEKNKREYVGEREKLIEDGYSPCKQCNP